ncbi:hypothetical protein POVWA1_040480 [Plasmodium ovale wallikeri]|uniref:Uncharacterized protein n=1 Tax=Plasmodium ovale wallikeri TaxID=864142 RepID=A0A1A8Z6W8_PLAOA|nr:hypothetical protein POVWA1_040480 [Plasmodium ovale wallikeri]
MQGVCKRHSANVTAQTSQRKRAELAQQDCETLRTSIDIVEFIPCGNFIVEDVKGKLYYDVNLSDLNWCDYNQDHDMCVGTLTGTFHYFPHPPPPVQAFRAFSSNRRHFARRQMEQQIKRSQIVSGSTFRTCTRTDVCVASSDTAGLRYSHISGAVLCVVIHRMLQF